MEDKTPKDVQKTDCCAEGECCSSSSTNEEQQNTGKKQWWKITALAVGILLIAAATSYSLITRHSAAGNGVLGQGIVPSVAANTSSAPARMGLGTLTWTQNLDALFAKNDVVFVILPKDDDSATAVTSQVSGAAEKIRAEKVSVSSMTLSPSNPEFSITTQSLGISQLPAVLILGKNGNGAIVNGNFDETKLLQAYLVAKQSICPPGSSSGCCPGK
jgi:hypothetical protein